MSMLFHVFGCIAVTVVIWVLVPHVPSKFAVGNFTNAGGWSSDGLSLMVGQVSMVACLGGFDSAVHMAEEVRNANVVVPKVMTGSLLVNGILGLLAAVTFAYSVPDITAALTDDTYYPFLYVLRQGVSPTGIYITTFILAFMVMVSNVTFLVAAARAAFAFARDGGVPFSGWVSRVNARTKSPINCIILTTFMSIILSVVYVGSSAAYNAIVSSRSPP